MVLKRNVLKFLAGAAIAGITAGSVARAEDAKKPAAGEAAKEGHTQCQGNTGGKTECAANATTAKPAAKAKAAPAAAAHGTAPAAHGTAPAAAAKKADKAAPAHN